MSIRDPFEHHPELRDKITPPLESFFRTFRTATILEQHPELAWVEPYLHTDEERAISHKAALIDHPEEDLWVFAYGSLMWDPAFQFAEVRRAHVPDYARRFILKDVLGGRGTPEAPGMMAALDKGDGCEGLAFRVAHADVDAECEILWRREYVAPSYIPTFVTAYVNAEPIKALTFIADHSADQICPDISRQEQVEYISTGSGFLGTSKEYLANIVSQFEVLGVVDDACAALLAEVEQELSARA